MSVWIPLESNPDVLTKYIHKLGVPKTWSVTDVIGLEPELLLMLPKPVKAIILLFPCSETYEKHRTEEDELIKSMPKEYPSNLFYMRQYTPNACGTVALIHSIANNRDIILEDGVLKKFLTEVQNLTPEERGKSLEVDKDITEDHRNLAQEGQTAADPEEKVNHHFIALVNVNGILYELDGRKSFPIEHGTTGEKTFVHDAGNVCKEFMARDPHELRFNILALTASEDS